MNNSYIDLPNIDIITPLEKHYNNEIIVSGSFTNDGKLLHGTQYTKIYNENNELQYITDCTGIFCNNRIIDGKMKIIYPNKKEIMLEGNFKWYNDYFIYTNKILEVTKYKLCN